MCGSIGRECNLRRLSYEATEARKLRYWLLQTASDAQNALKIVSVHALQICESKARVSSILLLQLIQFQRLPIVFSLLSVAPKVLLCN